MTTSRKAASAKTLTFSPLWVGAVATELGKKIEGARDDNGPFGPRQGQSAAPRLARVRDWLDTLEIRFGAGGEVPCRQSPEIRGLRRHERAPEDGEGLEHQLGPLVAQDRADDDVLAVGQSRQEVPDPGEVVRAVPDLERMLAAPLEPAGQRHVLRGVRVD